MHFLCSSEKALFLQARQYFFQSRGFFLFFLPTSKKQTPYIDRLTGLVQTFYITESQLCFSSRGPILLASNSWTLVRLHHSNTLVTFH